MAIERRDGSEIYRKIKFNYSIYGENSSYSGQTTIIINYGNYTEHPQIMLNSDFETLDKAEEAIILLAKDKIDNILG